MPKVGKTLAALYSRHSSHLPLAASSALTVTADGLIAVDATASGNTLLLMADLEKLGLTRSAHAGVMVSGLLPISAIEDVARLESLRAIRPAYVITASAPTSSQSLVVSQGDALIGADVARADFGVDGSGVNIGIISDSFDCQEGYGTDVANGELPDDVSVVLDFPGTFGLICDLPGTDEGRAIAQLIHDIAPGAGLTFHSNFPATPADMASAIDSLATVTGVDIIISDLVHLTEPMFQDGLIA